MRLILLAVILHLAHAEISQLPSYFKVCSRFDPNFNECGLKSGREIIPYLVKGERLFNSPPLDPLEIKEIKLSHGQGRGQLNLTMRDVKLLGLKDAYLQNYSGLFISIFDWRSMIALYVVIADNKEEEPLGSMWNVEVITGAVHDFNTSHTTFLLTVPQIKVLSTYNASGHILMLPIEGTGNMNITLVDTKCKIRYHFSSQKINGVDHLLLSAAKVHLDPKRMYIHLDNLFNGDKRFGDEMNELLNKHWKEVFYEITPHIAASFLEMFIGLGNTISKKIPYDLLVPEKLC